MLLISKVQRLPNVLTLKLLLWQEIDGSCAFPAYSKLRQIINEVMQSKYLLMYYEFKHSCKEVFGIN